WWYTPDAFWSMLQAHGQTPVREVVSWFEGCGREKASDAAKDFLGRPAGTLTRAEAASLLSRMREVTYPVSPGRLGSVGRLPEYLGYSGKRPGSFTNNGHDFLATVPFVVEVWANVADSPSAVVCVNRTPITAPLHVFRSGRDKAAYYIS